MKRLLKLVSVILVLSITLLFFASCDMNNRYIVDINVKDYGTIRVELDADSAPITVRNFVSLVEAKFYDGLTFHRIIDNFMIQGGCPKGDGTGHAEKYIYGEFLKNGYYNNNIRHDRGVISMARGTKYDSASCQFFITNAAANASLDGLYAAFGYVISGMNVVDAITRDKAPLGVGNDGAIKDKTQQPVIESIVIVDRYIAR